MTKKLGDTILDGPADAMIAKVAVVRVVNGDPANYAAAVAATLATTAFVGADVTKAAGDTSGRKFTLGAKTGVTISSGGQADHIIYDDGVGEILGQREITTPVVLTATANVDIPAGDAEFTDPT